MMTINNLLTRCVFQKLWLLFLLVVYYHYLIRPLHACKPHHSCLFLHIIVSGIIVTATKFAFFLALLSQIEPNCCGISHSWTVSQMDNFDTDQHSGDPKRNCFAECVTTTQLATYPRDLGVKNIPWRIKDRNIFYFPEICNVNKLHFSKKGTFKNSFCSKSMIWKG